MQYTVNVFGKDGNVIRHVEIDHSDGECEVTKDERNGATREENAKADTVYCPACGKAI